MYLVKTPFWLRLLYPSLLWRKRNSEKILYLTFDDGPIPEVTPFVLSVLKQFDAKATFFCIGDNVQKHSEVYQQVLDAGHAVGNHTFNHLKGWDTDDEKYIENFEKCRGTVTSDLFRPPYGKIKRSQISKLQTLYPELKIVMWDVLSGDFDRGLSPAKCLRKTIEATCPGSIIVFHDSIKAFKVLEDVLPKALEFWTKKGYRFETL